MSHRARNRELSDMEGFVEPTLWTGVGRARSGCGAALAGSTDQVLGRLEEYRKMGIRAFILSGYPHLDECRQFGERVPPKLKTVQLNEAYGRLPSGDPLTPLSAGERR